MSSLALVQDVVSYVPFAAIGAGLAAIGAGIGIGRIGGSQWTLSRVSQKCKEKYKGLQLYLSHSLKR